MRELNIIIDESFENAAVVDQSQDKVIEPLQTGESKVAGRDI